MISENEDRNKIKGLGSRVYIPIFSAGFNELLLVSIALYPAETFVDFDHGTGFGHGTNFREVSEHNFSCGGFNSTCQQPCQL